MLAALKVAEEARERSTRLRNHVGSTTQWYDLVFYDREDPTVVQRRRDPGSYEEVSTLKKRLYSSFHGEERWRVEIEPYDP